MYKTAQINPSEFNIFCSIYQLLLSQPMNWFVIVNLCKKLIERRNLTMLLPSTMPHFSFCNTSQSPERNHKRSRAKSHSRRYLQKQNFIYSVQWFVISLETVNVVDYPFNPLSNWHRKRDNDVELRYVVTCRKPKSICRKHSYNVAPQGKTQDNRTFFLTFCPPNTVRTHKIETTFLETSC